MIPEDLQGYLEVKEALDVPIAGGECEYTRFGFRELISRRAVDILQPDTCKTGGLSEAKKIAALASAWGIPYIPHVWGTPIAIAAALHLLAVLPETPSCRNALPFGQLPALEFDRTPHPIREELAVHPFRVEGGWVGFPPHRAWGWRCGRRSSPSIGWNLIRVHYPHRSLMGGGAGHQSDGSGPAIFHPPQFLLRRKGNVRKMSGAGEGSNLPSHSPGGKSLVLLADEAR